MPRYFVRVPFSLQTPVERSERVAGCWPVRARANPLSLGVWHFTLRFVLPGVGLATLAEGRKAVACSRPLDPKSTQSLPCCPTAPRRWASWSARGERYLHPRIPMPAIPRFMNCRSYLRGPAVLERFLTMREEEEEEEFIASGNWRGRSLPRIVHARGATGGRERWSLFGRRRGVGLATPS